MTGGKRLWTLGSSQLSSRTEEVTQVYTSALEHIVIAASEQATASFGLLSEQTVRRTHSPISRRRGRRGGWIQAFAEMVNYHGEGKEFEYVRERTQVKLVRSHELDSQPSEPTPVP